MDLNKKIETMKLDAFLETYLRLESEGRFEGLSQLKRTEMVGVELGVSSVTARKYVSMLMDDNRIVREHKD